MFKSKPEIIELELSNKFKFMYENFLISTQHDSYLLLEEKNDIVYVLKFEGSDIRYGGPNDEGRGAHSLTKYGALTYGFYEVVNSPWIEEQMKGNRCHPNHSDEMYRNKKHYIACFKDVMFETVCRGYSLKEMSKESVSALIFEELGELSA